MRAMATVRRRLAKSNNLIIIVTYQEIDIMTMLSVEKRLAALESKVFKNKMDADDVASKVDYIAVCDHPEVFDEVDVEMEADYESGI